MSRPASVLVFTTSLALLAGLVHWIGWSTLGDAGERLGVAGLAALLALGLAESALDTEALRSAVGGGRVGRLRLLGCNGAGAVANQVVPWDGGEAVKVALLRRHVTGADALDALVVWNYLFKFTRPLGLLFAWALGVWLGAAMQSDVLLAVLGGVALSVVPFGALWLLVRLGAIGVAARLLARLKILRNPDARIARAGEIDAHLREFAHRRRGAWREVISLQLGARVVAAVAFTVALQRIAPEVTLADALVAYAAVGVVGMLATVLPAQVGIGEGAAFAAFSLLGLAPAAGLVVVVAMRLKSILSNGLLAPLALHR